MSLDTVPEALTRYRAQLTALDIEKQALLEDIALGNNQHGERLVGIEQQQNDLIVELDVLENQYGRELNLAEQLLEVRQDISRQSDIASLQNQLAELQGNAPLLSLDVDTRIVANVIAGGA